MELRDRLAVVTGAASGIGRALAEALAERGCRLALVDRNQAGLASLAAGMATVPDLHVCDVGQRGAVAGLAEEVERRHGGAQLLINNAGVTLAASLAETGDDDLTAVLDTNLRGVIDGCRAFLPQLRRRGGRIVNLASAFGLVGFPGKTAYCASKFAVRGFSEALQAELRGGPVGLTVVYPGAVDTRLVEHGLAADPRRRAVEADWLHRHGLAPDTVARRIVRAVERDRDRLVVGADAWVLETTARWCPRLLARILARAGRRFADRPGSANGTVAVAREQ
jgi:short-subunit dehydrogenase